MPFRKKVLFYGMVSQQQHNKIPIEFSYDALRYGIHVKFFSPGLKALANVCTLL